MKDKVIIITGASSGIGLACAKEFAQKGSKIVLAARNKEKLSEIEHDFKREGCDVLCIPTDVSLENDCHQLIEKSIQHFGHIDVLINNAGISMRATFEDSELQVLSKLMDVNFWGCVFCTKYALPYLIQSKGSLIGVSSLAGFKGLPGRTGYSASKFAMQGFLETIRVENFKKGLHVMIAAPDFTASEIRKRALTACGEEQKETPKDENSLMTAEEVARQIYKGIVKRKRTIFLTFKGKVMVFLKWVAPGLLDKITYNTMAKEPNSPLK